MTLSVHDVPEYDFDTTDYICVARRRVQIAHAEFRALGSMSADGNFIAVDGQSMNLTVLLEAKERVNAELDRAISALRIHANQQNLS